MGASGPSPEAATAEPQASGTLIPSTMPDVFSDFFCAEGGAGRWFCSLRGDASKKVAVFVAVGGKFSSFRSPAMNFHATATQAAPQPEVHWPASRAARHLEVRGEKRPVLHLPSRSRFGARNVLRARIEHFFVSKSSFYDERCSDFVRTLCSRPFSRPQPAAETFLRPAMQAVATPGGSSAAGCAACSAANFAASVGTQL